MTSINHPQPRHPLHVPPAVIVTAFGLLAAGGLFAALMMNRDSASVSSPVTSPAIQQDVKSLPVAAPFADVPAPVIAYIVTTQAQADAAWIEIAESAAYDMQVGNPSRNTEVYFVADGENADGLIRQLYDDANFSGRALSIVDRRAQ